MAKTHTTLNLESPAKQPAAVVEQVTRPSRVFLDLKLVPKRLIAADSVVALIGAASAHCEVVLDSGERIGSRFAVDELLQTLQSLLGESLVGCGGRAGFFPDSHYIRLSAIRSLSPVDDLQSKVWFGSAPSPMIVPIAYRQLEEFMATGFDFIVTEPQRIRVAQPSVPDADLYTGSEEERYLDQVHGNSWERAGMAVPGRR